MQSTTRQTQLFIPALGGFYETVSELAYPLVRLVAGAMLIPHGWMKLFGEALAGTAQGMSSMGLEPAYPLAIYIALLELVGAWPFNSTGCDPSYRLYGSRCVLCSLG